MRFVLTSDVTENDLKYLVCQEKVFLKTEKWMHSKAP